MTALVLTFSFAMSGASAKDITNIAQARWNIGDQARQIKSNPVTFAVNETPVTLETYHLDASADFSVELPATQCGNRRFSLGNITAQNNASLAINLDNTNEIRIGETLVFGLTASAANLDAATVDSLRITLATPNGDLENLTIFETGVNTGLFMGSIATGSVPAPAIAGDCLLTLFADDEITIEAMSNSNETIIATTMVKALADPFGYVFDSETGEPVNGAIVTLIDVATGLPADVFAYDGITSWPSTIITGQPFLDGNGTPRTLPAGEYRFPLVYAGDYRLEITPPAPYSGPSVVQPAQLATLTRPDGTPLVIVAGSYGGTFVVTAPDAMQVDVPLDRPSLEIALNKSTSRDVAQPGDPIVYTITARNQDSARPKRDVVLTDTPSQWLRLRKDSVRVDGQADPDAVTVAPDGRTLTINLGTILAGASRRITYAMTVLPDAPAGDALNRAETIDSIGRMSRAQANLRITRDTIASRMTLIGRITAGDCSIKNDRIGIPGVRVMLEDGSFAITDADGRYHFDGLVPGTHVVQAQQGTLPADGEFLDCTRSTRSAGKANSRFITGQGGSLIVADFHAALPENALIAPAANTANTPADTNRATDDAAGGGTDWLALGDGPNGFLFPAMDHNPRAPAVRVVVRHRGNQKVELTADGQPVDPLAFDGTSFGTARIFAVSAWRAVHFKSDTLMLAATIRNADGSVAETLQRSVSFSNTPARAQVVRELSHLVADGATRPVLAVRITDRAGKPVHEGMTGEFHINQPYESAQSLDAMQARALSGLDRARPVWSVKGNDGIALIELAPTMVSGRASIDFTFVDDKQIREQTLDAWIVPGDQKWTLIGLAEGAAGARTIADQMERGGNFDSDLGENARVAFYAKGRVLGKYLLTAAYDSAKHRDDQPLLGAIDPNAYYTVYADGSDRRFDAASREKLYLRVETSTFYALYGDFETGFDQTELGRYNRIMTGVKAEYDDGTLHAKAFAAEVGSTHRRDEIQGDGLSGPYPLSSRNIIPNSERVILEVRDRFRSELIVEARELTRFIDYDIDLLTGTIRFSRPILSRDASLNPQFIVVDYEVDALGQGQINAGVRADYTTKDKKLRIGATLITDKGEAERTDVVAVDVRARLGEKTEIRAEAALSRSGGETQDAWLVEVEHHDEQVDVLAYARSASQDFGTGQQNSAERGRTKYGVDARYSFTENLSVTGSGWIDEAHDGSTSRRAVRMRGEYRQDDLDLLVGLTHFDDSLQGGANNSSTILEGGATKRLLENRLELSAISSIALDDTSSVDLPARHRFGARYAITSDIRVIGDYEIAKGDAINARTARVGLEVAPWAGARIVSSLGQQSVTEYGKRSFAAFGLAQTLEIAKGLSVDATLDHNRTIGGDLVAGQLVNPDQPAASGGQLAGGSALSEDFTAVTLGATYRHDRWSATVRAEQRDGQFADRKGLTFGAIRQLGEGAVVGSGFTWTRAQAEDGATTQVFDGAIVAALRPDQSEWAMLSKLQFRSDKVTGAVAGQAGAAGPSLFTIDGDAISRRLIGSVSMNWTPQGQDEGSYLRRSEFGLFLGSRYNFDEIEGYDLAAWSLLAGADARIGLGDHVEIGATATVRADLESGYVRYAVGPHIGVSPTDDVLVTLGYNFVGFRDPDFSTARHTNKGLFVSGKIKFDANSFGFLGLGG